MTTSPTQGSRMRTAARAEALHFDGSQPAQGTTDTRAARATNPPLRGDPSCRDRATYDDVINQFAVGNNPRYAPRDSSGDGIRDTFCNIFLWDVTRAMCAEIPHWVDGNSDPAPVGSGRELSANATVDWLRQHGHRHGWRRVSDAEAQRLANQGHPCVVVWKNPGGTGHVAVVRPGEVTSQGPAIAQAGVRNFNHGHVRDAFRNAPVEYWGNGGEAVEVPKVALCRGDKGPEVERLQEVLVKLGYMTREQVATGPGTFGPQTEAAVSSFQVHRGITPASGRFDPKTREAMEVALAG